MDFLIDGIVQTLYCGPGMTLKDVVEHYHQELLGKRRVVVGISLNGVQLNSNWEKALQSTPASQVSRLELTTSTLRQLASNILRETVSYLPRLAEGFEEGAEDFDRGDDAQAWEKLSTCVKSWLEVLSALTAAATTVGVTFDELVTPSGLSLDQLIGRMKTILGSLAQPSTPHGAQGPSTLVREELLPILEECYETVEDMIRFLDQPLH